MSRDIKLYCIICLSNIPISHNRKASFNYNYILLITSDVDNISKQNPFRASNKSAFQVWSQ